MKSGIKRSIKRKPRRIQKDRVIPVLTYEYESLTMIEKHISKRSKEIKFLRKIERKTRGDFMKVTLKRSRKKLQEEQLKWLGDINRMKEEKETNSTKII